VTRRQRTAENVSPVRRKTAAVVTLARGGTVPAAAAAAAVSERTLYRWRADPGFAAEVSATRRQLLDEIVGGLADAGVDAVATLRSALEADSEAVRVRAASLILATLVTVRESVEAEERVAALEEHARSGRPLRLVKGRQA
jgi:hypothetical protein